MPENPVSPPELLALLPPACAVMVLPGGALFPHQRTPLNLFEPRYRTMLADALAGNRMFAIGMAKDGAGEEPANFEAFGGIGLVRACVQQEDGTSQLVLQGLCRVRFYGEVDERPYRWSAIEPLPSQTQDPTAAEHWLVQLRRYGRRLAKRRPETFQLLGEICREDLEPGLQADLACSALPLAPTSALRLLAEPVAERRLEWLARATEAILTQTENNEFPHDQE